MGKKSKAKRKSAPSPSPASHPAPSSRPPAPLAVETRDNLNFEDPFEDEFADDDMEVVDGAEEGEGGGNLNRRKMRDRSRRGCQAGHLWARMR